MAKAKKYLKGILEGAFFILVMGLTFFAVFKGQDIGEIFASITKINVGFLVIALIMALLYVSCEGYMIWLMVGNERKIGSLFKCIGYSCIGFFYSGITPGASGGQPMQLYYMSRDGFSFSKSCAALTVVAVSNKFVLGFSGILLFVVWNKTLHNNFGDYMWWYYLGLAMVIVMVVILCELVFVPEFLEKIILKIIAFFEKRKILKEVNADKRKERVKVFFDGYRDVRNELIVHKSKVVRIVLISFLQRAFLTVLTYMIYLGFGLKGTSGVFIFFTQLSIYITVDMLPLPGGQGISEFLYRRVFSKVFTGELLTASMCISRLTGFYFLLFISLGVSVFKSVKTFVLGKHKRDRVREDLEKEWKEKLC